MSSRAREWLGAARSWLLLAPVVATLLLLAGLFGQLPVEAATAVGVGLVTAQAAGWLIRHALKIHASTHTFGPCRGAGFLGMGALTSGISAVAVCVVEPAARPEAAMAGMVIAALFYMLGVLLLPGAASTISARLRRGIDGWGVGTSLAFAAYLVPGGNPMPPIALAATLIASGALSIVVITALRAMAFRPAALLCGAGASAAVVGLAGMVQYAFEGHSTVLVTFGALVAAGPMVAVRGARLAKAGPTPVHSTDRESALSGYPVLAVPMLIAAGAAFYHAMTVREFDRTSILLGLAICPPVALREVLAAWDIRRYSQRLIAQETHFRSLVAGANDLIMMVGDDLTVRWQSPAAARLFGLSDAEVIGKSFAELLHPDDAIEVTGLLRGVVSTKETPDRPPVVTARLRDGYGVWRDTESTISDQRAVPEVAALVLHVRDIGERRHLERTLHQLTLTDQLTGLPNRRAMMRTIASQRDVSGQTGALLVLDLHGIAEINDEHGREMGDAVLIEVGRRLTTQLTADDLAARLTGDEFAVLTGQGPVLAYAVGTRLLTALTEPYQLPGAIVDLHVSIGLAELAGGGSVEDVLRRADLARRRARQLGRDRIEWYDSYLEEQLLRRMDMEREIAGAVDRGEFDVIYQPILSLPDGLPLGVEALMRWRHPTLGTIMPAELLPVAEDLGLLPEIGRWVLAKAARQFADWGRENRELWLAVNVSPRELAEPDFVHRVAEILSRYGLAADQLVLEVAESKVELDVPAVISQFAKLRALGARTALDDFGAGQASLAQLRRMPVDMLKIAGPLISRPANSHPGAQPLIDVIVDLGRRLGLEIYAKGLETEEQVAEAHRAGCRGGQGFALSRPAPAERVEAFLEEPSSFT